MSIKEHMEVFLDGVEENGQGLERIIHELRAAWNIKHGLKKGYYPDIKAFAEDYPEYFKRTRRQAATCFDLVKAGITPERNREHVITNAKLLYSRFIAWGERPVFTDLGAEYIWQCYQFQPNKEEKFKFLFSIKGYDKSIKDINRKLMSMGWI